MRHNFPTATKETTAFHIPFKYIGIKNTKNYLGLTLQSEILTRHAHKPNCYYEKQTQTLQAHNPMNVFASYRDTLVGPLA